MIIFWLPQTSSDQNCLSFGDLKCLSQKPIRHSKFSRGACLARSTTFVAVGPLLAPQKDGKKEKKLWIFLISALILEALEGEMLH